MNASHDIDLVALMEEPPHGHNDGRSASADPEVEGRNLPLNTEAWKSRELMQGQGFAVVETHRGSNGRPGKTYGAGDAGMSAHRGILHPDEYVDETELADLAASELGFTTLEVRKAYVRDGGRPANDTLALRARLDARLVEVQAAGGDMTALAHALGMGERTMDRALARGREAAEVQA